WREMGRLAQGNIRKCGQALHNVRGPGDNARNAMKAWSTLVLFAAWSLAAIAGLPAAAGAEPSPVIAPPESFFELVSPKDREPARKFYRKYLDAQGLPVVASAEVADQALDRTR